ncbi:HlyD family type I secretion periplasmic adaptor subunit [Balneatrix alpica]|uniref:HlyD family type I secretion periplasmic adaptor subunit n=1 Tax=Balneatrix alpica TaxID=75684 RepID=UPI0027390544|nr:HlyD family type I secretion periplasmic adaptor subunit [Balneatrix alpica]
MVKMLDSNGNEVASSSLPIYDYSIRRIGYVIVFLAFGVFGGWALFAPLDSAALAPGEVTIKDNRKTIQHFEGGIVKELLVREGERVAAGQPLIILDSTKEQASLDIIIGQYFVSLAKLARLELEESLSLDVAKINYPDELINTADVRAAEAISSQNKIYTTRREALLGQLELLNQQVKQYNSQISGLKAQKVSKERLVSSYKKEIADLRVLLSDGYAEKTRLRELERQLDNNLGEIASIDAEIASSNLKITEAELKSIQIKKEYQKEAADAIASTEVELQDLSERKKVLLDSLNRKVILSPEAGKVLSLQVHTIGGVIGPGNAIMDIVPEQEELVITSQISPIDIDRVMIGQDVEVRFSAFKSSVTPRTHGVLVDISGDKLINEQTGMPYYLAKIRLKEGSATALKEKGLELLPGMPVEALINTGSRTFAQYLVQPLTNFFARSMLED